MMEFSRALFRALGRPRALFYVYFWRLLSAWLVASPIARASSSPVVGHPRGDAVLFEPGGLELCEALRSAYPVLGSELRGATLAAALLGFLSLIPLAGLLVALQERERTGVGAWTARAVAELPLFTLLGGATLLGQAALGVSAGLGIAALRRRFALAADERALDLGSVAVVLFALGLMGLLAVVQDLARARLIVARETVLVSVKRALGTLRARPVSALLAFACSVGTGLLAVALTAWMVGRLDVSQPGGWRVLAVALVHQATILVMIVARAGWLGVALDLAEINAPAPASAGRSAGSAAPVDPSPNPNA